MNSVEAPSTLDLFRPGFFGHLARDLNGRESSRLAVHKTLFSMSVNGEPTMGPGRDDDR